MSNINNGGSAFPNPHFSDISGMSLRDYFAAKAMQGLFSGKVMQNILNDNYPGKYTREIIAEEAYCLADAMLAERAKGTE